MGKGKPSRGRSKVPCGDDSDDDQCSTAMSNLKLKPKQQFLALERYLEQLFEKRGSTREKALSLIVDSFKNNVQRRFVNVKCITLLHRCLNSIKQGSAREICLASQVIGLLSITVGCTDGLAHEILEDSVSVLSTSLESASEPLKIASLLDCLAVITFVGGQNIEETERSMQVIWQIFHPNSGSHGVNSDHTSHIFTVAISAWTFLLTTIDNWNIDSKLWRESMSYFLNLLHNNHLPLRMAAGEALALIFEIGNLKKFFDESKSLIEGSTHKGGEEHPSLEGLKDKILNQVRILSMEVENNESTEKGLIKSHQTLFRDVLRVIKGSYSSESGIKIGGGHLKISMWSQLVQVNYLKRFLGGGFLKHAQENELLHDFLEFNPRRNKQLAGQQNISCDEKVAIQYVYQPEVSQEDDLHQRKLYSSSSVINKSKTQLLNKKRMLSQARNEGYYAASLADEDA